MDTVLQCINDMTNEYTYNYGPLHLGIRKLDGNSSFTPVLARSVTASNFCAFVSLCLFVLIHNHPAAILCRYICVLLLPSGTTAVIFYRMHASLGL